MHVLVVEPHASGHHAAYLRWAIEAIMQAGAIPVVAITADAARHPQLQFLQTGATGVVVQFVGIETDVPAGMGLFRTVQRELAYWRIIRREINRATSTETRIGHVFIPYVDYAFHALCLLGCPSGGIPWSGISMRLAAPRQPPSTLAAVKWQLARRLLTFPALRCLLSINPSAIEWVKGSRHADKLRYLRDPGEQRATVDRRMARERLGIAPDAVVLLIFGSIDRRKGLEAALEVLAADTNVRGLCAVVAGRQNGDMRGYMESPSPAKLCAEQRLVTVDHVLDDEDQARVFSAADIVWLGYRDHVYMSGVLVLAGQAGLPVVASAEGEIGRIVGSSACGIVVDVDDARAIGDALRRLLNRQLRQELGDRGRKTFGEHTVQSFKQSIVDAISSEPYRLVEAR